jgi:hypothetical protein
MHTRSTLIALVMLITSSKDLFLLGFSFSAGEAALVCPDSVSSLVGAER